MGLAHDVRQVILVFLLADCAVSVPFMRLREDNLPVLFDRISHLSIVFYQLLFLISFESSFIYTEDEGAGEIIAIVIEDRKGIFRLSWFSMILGAEGGLGIKFGEEWIDK